MPPPPKHSRNSSNASSTAATGQSPQKPETKRSRHDSDERLKVPGAEGGGRVERGRAPSPEDTVVEDAPQATNLGVKVAPLVVGMVESESTSLESKPPKRELDAQELNVFVCKMKEPEPDWDLQDSLYSFIGDQGSTILQSLHFTVAFSEDVQCGYIHCCGNNRVLRAPICFCLLCFTPICSDCCKDPELVADWRVRHVVANTGVMVGYPIVPDDEDDSDTKAGTKSQRYVREWTNKPHSHDITRQRLEEWEPGQKWDRNAFYDFSAADVPARYTPAEAFERSGARSETPERHPNMSDKQYGKSARRSNRTLRAFTPEEMRGLQVQSRLPSPDPNPQDDEDKDFKLIRFALEISMNDQGGCRTSPRTRSLFGGSEGDLEEEEDEQMRWAMEESKKQFAADQAAQAVQAVQPATKDEGEKTEGQKKREVSVASSGGEGPATGETVRPNRKPAPGKPEWDENGNFIGA